MILIVASNATRLTFPLVTTKYRSVITATGNITWSGKKCISQEAFFLLRQDEIIGALLAAKWSRF